MSKNLKILALIPARKGQKVLKTKILYQYLVIL